MLESRSLLVCAWSLLLEWQRRWQAGRSLSTMDRQALSGTLSSVVDESLLCVESESEREFCRQPAYRKRRLRAHAAAAATAQLLQTGKASRGLAVGTADQMVHTVFLDPMRQNVAGDIVRTVSQQISLAKTPRRASLYFLIRRRPLSACLAGTVRERVCFQQRARRDPTPQGSQWHSSSNHLIIVCFAQAGIPPTCYELEFLLHSAPPPSRTTSRGLLLLSQRPNAVWSNGEAVMP